MLNPAKKIRPKENSLHFLELYCLLKKKTMPLPSLDWCVHKTKNDVKHDITVLFMMINQLFVLKNALRIITNRHN